MSEQTEPLTIFQERSLSKQAERAAADEVGAEDWWVLQAQNLPAGAESAYMRRNGFPTSAIVSEAQWFEIEEGANNSKANLFGIEWKAVLRRFTAEMVHMHKTSFHV